MPRTFDANDLVSLPKLDAASASTLATELVTASKAPKKLISSIAAARDDLTLANRTLKTALKKRVAKGAQSASDADARSADIDVDSAWAAFFHWLTGWSKLPGEHPEKAEAAAILDLVFPEGLKFTQLAFKQEWSEVEARLAQLSEIKTELRIVKLGGVSFLKALRDTHKVYGKTLGVTAPKAQKPSPDAGVRAALDAVEEALRTYVLRVSANICKDKPKTAELAAALLEPLTTWESRTRSKGADAAPSDKPAGEASGDASGNAPDATSPT